MTRVRGVLIALCLLLALPTAGQTATRDGAVIDRRIAITIDDLPWQALGEPQVGDYTGWHRKLIAQLGQADAPIIGFVNEQKLEMDGKVNSARLATLADWLDAGFDLGNHTYAHQSLHDIGVQAFQQSILDGERQLRPRTDRGDPTARLHVHHAG